ncbi:MAG: segregation/condensation protein A [Syntrophomonadaceae bacterium]|nr:segregation/condensation protein A [Syntrophomonadaceae bacterium]
MSYLVNLDKFYGPLDLLLYLIEKEEMDIYDIPIARIADQYIEFIENTGRIDLDNIGEFLIMASCLLNLKSRMLLPRLESGAAGEEEILDPREELINRILEYRQFKLAAEFLASRYEDEVNRVFFRYGQTGLTDFPREITTSLGLLVRAWYALQSRHGETPAYQLPENDFDVSLKMEKILERLPPNGQTVVFQELFAKSAVRREYLAYFLALLELIRLKKVEAIQEYHGGDIKVCLQVGE